jgi:hypothetical protein
MVFRFYDNEAEKGVDKSVWFVLVDIIISYFSYNTPEKEEVANCADKREFGKDCWC